MLLGGAAAGWAALATLTHPTAEARALAARHFFLGLALGALGLASSAGVAACCYALLTYALLCTLPNGIRLPNWVNWAQAGALPLTAPFMACWLAVGAAAASGASVLAGALWLAALLRGVALLLELPAETDADPRTGLPAGERPCGERHISTANCGLPDPAGCRSAPGWPDRLWRHLSIAPWVGLSLLDSRQSRGDDCANAGGGRADASAGGPGVSALAPMATLAATRQAPRTGARALVRAC